MQLTVAVNWMQLILTASILEHISGLLFSFFFSTDGVKAARIKSSMMPFSNNCRKGLRVSQDRAVDV